MAIKTFHRPIKKEKPANLTTEGIAKRLFPQDMVNKLKEISKLPKHLTIIKKG